MCGSLGVRQKNSEPISLRVIQLRVVHGVAHMNRESPPDPFDARKIEPPSATPFLRLSLALTVRLPKLSVFFLRQQPCVMGPSRYDNLTDLETPGTGLRYRCRHSTSPARLMPGRGIPPRPYRNRLPCPHGVQCPPLRSALTLYVRESLQLTHGRLLRALEPRRSSLSPCASEHASVGLDVRGVLVALGADG